MLLMGTKYAAIQVEPNAPIHRMMVAIGYLKLQSVRHKVTSAWNLELARAMVCGVLVLTSTPGAHIQHAEPVGNVFKQASEHFDAKVRVLREASLGPSDSGYNIDDVNAVVLQTSSEIMARIPADDSPLKSYVQRRLPKQVEGTELSVAKHEGDNIFSQLRSLLDTLTALQSLRLNLQINSSPPHALFELVPLSGTRLSSATNGLLTNVYRGEYQYTLTKAGYKTISFTINFIDRSGRVLDCNLVLTSDSQNALPCAFN